jgi:hypothetical protein
MAPAQKDQLLEIGSGAAVRLAHHMRRIERPPRQTTVSGGVRTNLLFTMSYRTGGEQRSPQTCFLTNDLQIHSTPTDGGARRDRTDDLMLAKHALSQLSYGP